MAGMKIRLLYPLLIVSAIVSFSFSPTVFALDPPPGGAYPNRVTALGQDALFSVTASNDDTAIGYQALYNSTGGNGANTCVGSMTLHSNTSGYANVALGFASLFGNTTGIF